MSRRNICRSYNLHPHQQRCAYTISPQKPHPSLRRYTFLSHLTTKSKISVRWIKKLVAATYGVCMFIHKLSPSHITPILIYPFIFPTTACAIRNGGFCESRRHICRSYILHPHQQRCAYTISPQKPHPSLRRYTFLSHLTTKSKISVRWINLCVGIL